MTGPFLAAPIEHELRNQKYNGVKMFRELSKIAAVCIAALGIGSLPTLADEHETCGVDVEKMQPSGKITGSIKTIGWLVGARWDHGVLTLENGEEHKFKVIGAKALETGAAKDTFEGDVYNLKDVKDFPGTFYGASHNINLGPLGKGEAVANNARCVVIKVRMKGEGLKVSGPAPSAVEVSFID